MDATRRRFLGGVGVSGAIALAGCSGFLGSGSDIEFEREPPELAQPIRGDNGPLVETYVDYACPHCHEFESRIVPEIEDLIQDGKMRFTTQDFPIPIDSTWSWQMPNVPRSAQAQTGTTETFWAVHDYIWANWNGGNFDEEYVRQVASEFDLNPDQTWREVQGEFFRADIEADKSKGEDAGVSGTPSVIIDGELFEAPGAETIRSAVEAANE